MPGAFLAFSVITVQRIHIQHSLFLIALRIVREGQFILKMTCIVLFFDVSIGVVQTHIMLITALRLVGLTTRQYNRRKRAKWP